MTPLFTFEYENSEGVKMSLDVDMTSKEISFWTTNDDGICSQKKHKFENYEKMFNFLMTKVDMKNVYYSEFQLFLYELEENIDGRY